MNTLSLDGLAPSTANLFTLAQPRESLLHVPASNPTDTEVAYGGAVSLFGTTGDLMVGHSPLRLEESILDIQEAINMEVAAIA